MFLQKVENGCKRDQKDAFFCGKSNICCLAFVWSGHVMIKKGSHMTRKIRLKCKNM